MEPLNCYICNSTSMFYCKNIYKLASKHTETAICDFIVKFLGKELSRVVTNEDEENIVCTDCLNKIDEYDLACMTVERVERELRAALLLTESIYATEPVFVDILEREFDDEIDGSKTSLKIERRLIQKVENASFSASYRNNSLNSNEAPTSEVKQLTTEPIIKIEILEQHLLPKTKKTNLTSPNKKTKAKGKTVKKEKLQYYSCSQCPADFPTKYEMRQHEKEHPPEPFSFTCEICGLATKTSAGLSRHKQLHSKGEPFECEICQKIFKKKNSLARHMRIHTGEKFYQCDKCGVEFIHKSSFRMHIMAHDDIREKKCPHCTLSFRSTSHLNRHLRIHTGAKPYSCPECGQRFAQRYNMMVHFRIHKGISRSSEKNHVCSICNIAFVRAQKLTEHYRKAHETIPHTVVAGQLSTSLNSLNSNNPSRQNDTIN